MKSAKKSAIGDRYPPGANAALEQALEQLRQALELLDRASAPDEIGAKIDLAIHELYCSIASRGAGPRLDQIERNAVVQ